MIKKFPLYFAPAAEERLVHLYLPEGYSRSRKERYPVIYMFDGQNLYSDKEATYGQSWRIKDFLDQWDKKVIVVGVECSHHGNARLSEYCPYHFNAKWAGGEITGTGVTTMEWLVNEVKPYIDAHYRTWAHREATAIGGSSMGGMMALFAVLRYNHIFSKSAAVSPAFFQCLPLFMKELKINSINPDTRLFFSWGTEEDKRGWTTAKIMKMEAAVQAKGVKTWLYHQQGGFHCERCWAEQVPTWMNFLWK